MLISMQCEERCLGDQETAGWGTQNRMIAGRPIVGVLALPVVFCGMAAAEQRYVSESGCWWEGGAFNVSTAPM